MNPTSQKTQIRELPYGRNASDISYNWANTNVGNIPTFASDSTSFVYKDEMYLWSGASSKGKNQMFKYSKYNVQI